MKGKVGFQFNYAAIPNRVKDPEVANALRAFISGMERQFGGISPESYNVLPDWQKVYWKSFEVETPKKKVKK